MKSTPIHRDTLALCGVLLEELGAEAAAVLQQRMALSALTLLEDVTLAVAGHDRTQHLAEADANLQLLRIHLRLAHHLDLLDEDSFQEFTEQTNVVGRQVGGWLKSLGSNRE